MTDGRTAFVLGSPSMSEQAATALRASGYRVVVPAELDEMAGIERDMRDPHLPARDIEYARECDLIVLVPGWAFAPACITIVDVAKLKGVEVAMIRDVAPSWAVRS